MTGEDTTIKTTEEQQPATDVKGKGKAVEEKPAQLQDEEIDDSEDEDEDMDDVEVDEGDVAEQDDMEEIDTSNIVSRRTRGKKN